MKDKFIGSICKFIGQAILGGYIYDCYKCVVDGSENCWCKKVSTTHIPPGGCDPILGCLPPVRNLKFGGCSYE
ncbi:MAG TPA: hypothetical protein PK103_04325 [Elusimicrobiales bacterium]|nr:hypothetical protein [Elusimicrobiales bacterium]HOL62579.1 hypothetical protein [Elusimicrobiales bacterium]HPO95585.1 hypothetical protein [Elusimicrobiales bacterium]